MRSETLAGAALLVLVAGLVVLGILTVGGPAAGRMEKRDRERFADLRELSGYIQCLADRNSETLPERFETNPDCRRKPALDDPQTGQPYQYERISDAAFRLCAAFELPERLRRWWDAEFDVESGCATFRYTP